MSNIVTTMIEAFTSFLSGIGSAIVGVFEDVVLTSTGTLTPFATWGLVFMGVSLAIGILTTLLRKAS